MSEDLVEDVRKAWRAQGKWDGQEKCNESGVDLNANGIRTPTDRTEVRGIQWHCWELQETLLGVRGIHGEVRHRSAWHGEGKGEVEIQTGRPTEFRSATETPGR